MYGAKLQIYKQINPLSDEALPSDLHMPASIYLARCAFKALEEMFSSARSIQVCAEEIRQNNDAIFSLDSFTMEKSDCTAHSH
jgi:hypothetical protein